MDEGDGVAGAGAMNGSDFGEATLPTVGGANVYMDYMHRFQTMYMDSKKKIAELEKDNLELKQQLEAEEDRRENMQMEILIVKGDLNLERNQRIALEDKLRFMTETLWKNRDSDSAAKRTNSSNSSTSMTARASSPSPTNSYDVRSLKENQAANLVMKEKHQNFATVSPSQPDQLLNLLESLSSSSSCQKKVRFEDSSGVVNEFNNPRSNRRAATPKATVAPTRMSLRRLSAVSKQMEKEDPKKPPSQGNPKVPKRKNDQCNFNYGYHDDFVTQPQPRRRNKERHVVLETELASSHGSQEFSSNPPGFLPPPRMVNDVEGKKTSSDVTTTVKIQSKNDFVQALQRIMDSRAKNN